MTQPPPRAVGGGVFDVDITQAPQAIRQLEQAREELESIRDEVQTLGQVKPPTSDQVSIDAATALGRAAVGGPGAFLDALDAGIREINGLVQALRSGFDAYQRRDDDGRAGIDRSA